MRNGKKNTEQKSDQRKSRLESSAYRYSLPHSFRDVRLIERDRRDYFELSNWPYWLGYRGERSKSDEEIEDLCGLYRLIMEE